MPSVRLLQFQWNQVTTSISESISKVIPNGAYCLFRSDEGGTRSGKIILAQSMHYPDAEFGSSFTVKRYLSTKRPQYKKLVPCFY